MYIEHGLYWILYIATDHFSNCHLRRLSALDPRYVLQPSTCGIHVVVQALDPRYVFQPSTSAFTWLFKLSIQGTLSFFKPRAPTLLTLSTTFGLHLDNCTM